MLTRIDDLYLYTDIDWQSDQVQESHMATKFLEENEVQYILMNYHGSEAVREAALEPLRTWKFHNGENPGGTTNLTEFPFLIYTEVHDDLPPSQYPKIIIKGLDALLDSNIVELYQLGR